MICGIAQENLLIPPSVQFVAQIGKNKKDPLKNALQYLTEEIKKLVPLFNSSAIANQ